ncbi:MAG: Smr/MutS family protein [Tannerellaceae bacterium]|jgi:DNA mismatch repair protein MutS2|nr:Smr/MutS family protein [Tannerellaceae bacterium]
MEETEAKVGFEAVRQMVADRCLSVQGRERVSEMVFLTDYDRIRERLEQTAEFVGILHSGAAFPSEGFPDVRQALHRIRPEGTWLDEGELFGIQRALHCLHETLRFFRSVSTRDTPRYPRLSVLAEASPDFPQLSQRIAGLLDRTGRVRDDASPELGRIRRELTVTAAGISRSLLSILRSAQAEGWVDRDAAPALRDGRLVIPVSPTYKRRIRGIVHDESATGKTVFIEPEVVVEANNRIRELEGEEKREIIRLLTDLTVELRPLTADMLAGFAFLGEMDFIRAKAVWAVETGGEMPVLERKAEIDWIHAVHPLLFLSLRKQGRRVVPLDITLNDKQRILVISGPNAGGKSVCLKTVGLLQYMLQCGLPIPVAANSHAGVFSRILIDIGDEQSIENDLSTYSSHLSNMKRFLRLCGETTLLLIDEFGTGTEPHIGGAIAEALLDRFNRRGSFGIITTHYTNLKQFAESAEGIVNGAMLYDRQRMEPLFRLDIGNPGSSFAIEIARRMGLPEDVIAEASAKVGTDYVDMDKYLQDIVRDKRYWENKRQDIRHKEKHLESISARYEQDLATLERERKEILRTANEEAARTIAAANARIEQTIREIRESQADKERTKELRRRLSEQSPSSAISAALQRRPYAPLRKKEKERPAERVSPLPLPAAEREQGQVAGRYVRLRGQTVVGKVLSVQGQKAVVAFGDIKGTVPLSHLEEAKKPARSAPPNTVIYERRLHFRQELDLHGVRAAEALKTTIQYIDDAILLGVPRVRIIHGTGSGVLRQVVRDYLASVSAVRRYGDEDFDLGGPGATVVDFD